MKKSTQAISKESTEKVLGTIRQSQAPISAADISRASGVNGACTYRSINTLQGNGSITVKGSGSKGARLFVGV